MRRQTGQKIFHFGQLWDDSRKLRAWHLLSNRQASPTSTDCSAIIPFSCLVSPTRSPHPLCLPLIYPVLWGVAWEVPATRWGDGKGRAQPVARLDTGEETRYGRCLAGGGRRLTSLPLVLSLPRPSPSHSLYTPCLHLLIPSYFFPLHHIFSVYSAFGIFTCSFLPIVHLLPYSLCLFLSSIFLFLEHTFLFRYFICPIAVFAPVTDTIPSSHAQSFLPKLFLLLLHYPFIS